MGVRKFLRCALFALPVAAPAQTPAPHGFTFVEDKAKKQIDLLYNGNLLTSYCTYDSVMKPILYPINSLTGVTITRGFPIQPKPGDPTDHPHQVGLWFTYENVNGIDFWNNSTAIAPNKRSGYGHITQDVIVRKDTSGNEAVLETSAQWRKQDNTALLAEVSHYDFRVDGNNFIIDRSTTLIGLKDDVLFKDAKDGLFGLRVAPELELSTAEPAPVIGADGTPGKRAVADSVATGHYLSSEGKTDDQVWGTRAQWVYLTGTKDGQPVSVAIFDHPANPGYPTYWHARNYGLFAANPLGQEIFSDGKEKLDFQLKTGQQVTFRYRVVIHSGSPLTAAELTKLNNDFKSEN